MALTDSEKHEVLFRLGWSGKTLDEGSTNFSKIIADRLNNLSVPMESTIRGLLKRLNIIQKQMDDSLCRMTAEKVDGISINKDEASMLKKEFMRYLRELSNETCILIARRGGVNISVGQ